MSRKTAREIAMKLVFSKLLGGEGDYMGLLELSGIEETSTDADKAFASSIEKGIEANRQAIDEKLEEFSIGWSLASISCVDICILRIAVFEMIFGDVPSSVSINEAVELAKQFGTEKSPVFINGVLGGIARSMKEKDE